MPELGVASFRLAVEVDIGLFCAMKNGGLVRRIVDCHRANCCPATPPVTRLSSGAALAGLGF
eukprot:10443718-Alexandrium_andersonii.AAC.1